MRLDRQTALNMMSNLLELKRRRGDSVTGDAVSFYGFTPDDIFCVHFWKGDEEGTWFRLNDGRVIDENGKPADSDETLYAAPTSPRAIVL
ncbi:MAG: hypothetical protein PW788_06855 [Micavibrio sp.]|nr:hypothetical protein [Micavibrio sp.]